MPDSALLSREQLRQRHLKEASLRSQRLAAKRLRRRRLFFVIWQVILPILGLILSLTLIAAAITVGQVGKAQTMLWVDAALTSLAIPH